jgi:hypothetical protein
MTAIFQLRAGTAGERLLNHKLQSTLLSLIIDYI